MDESQLFPLAAISGLEKVKRALLIALCNRRAGGLLISGPKGTAKSVAVRSCCELLDKQCLVELPLNATEDMIFGTIDLEYALSKGERRFLPGILARAHRQILYIDDINLLRPELLAAVLDTNQNGMNRVEREGLSLTRPAEYTVIGTMNPEEGILAPQLLERFGMFVACDAVTEVGTRVEIMQNLLEFWRSPESLREKYQAATSTLREELAAASRLVRQVEISEAMMYLAAEMCAAAFSRGHRAELFLLEAARSIAALAKRAYLLPGDLEEAALFVLPHRTGSPQQEEQQREEQAPQPPEQSEQKDGEDDQESGSTPSAQDEALPAEDVEAGEQEPEMAEDSPSKDEQPEAPAGEHTAAIDKRFALPELKLDLGKDRTVRRGSGKRSLTKTDLKQGRYVRAVIRTKEPDLALDATIRAAAPFQRLRRHDGCAVSIYDADLRHKLREKRIGSTFLFVVDASGSMGARERMWAVKGVIFTLLTEAYQKRDRVGMIAFRRKSAEIILPVTRSVDLAEKRLQELPTGGKTPLAEGLEAAYRMLHKLSGKDKEQETIVVLITDGRVTAEADSPVDQVQQALKIAEGFRKENIVSLVIDTEQDFIKLGIARKIADAMGGSYHRLDELSDEKLLHIVKSV